MTVKFIFSNILGSFVFSQNYKLLDGLLFKDIAQYKDKKKIRRKINAKEQELNYTK